MNFHIPFIHNKTFPKQPISFLGVWQGDLIIENV
jgi:hypothetical protein